MEDITPCDVCGEPCDYISRDLIEVLPRWDKKSGWWAMYAPESEFYYRCSKHVYVTKTKHLRMTVDQIFCAIQTGEINKHRDFGQPEINTFLDDYLKYVKYYVKELKQGKDVTCLTDQRSALASLLELVDRLG